MSSIGMIVRETYSLDLKHKKNAIDILANITCVIVAAIDMLTCIMWLIISRVQGMRVRWAGVGNFDASSLTAFKILSSNAVQHWTNLVTIPYCTLDIIDGIDRTLHWVHKRNMLQTLTIFPFILNIAYFCNLAHILHLLNFANCYRFVIFAKSSIFTFWYYFAN